MIIKYGAIFLLKCNKHGCDWETREVPKKAMQFWVNKGCPKCADKVLTREQYSRFESRYGV